MTVTPIPEGFRTVTPYLVVAGVPRLIAFLSAAFGAQEIERTQGPDGRVMHAQVRIGDSVVMMGEAMEGFPAVPSHIYLYVPDADTVFRAGIGAGGVSVMEIATQPYGDRCGGVRDPSGNTWWIATHVEDVPPDELARRMQSRSEK